MNTDTVTIYARRGSESMTVRIPVADLGPVTYVETVPPEPYTVETHDEVLRRERLAFKRSVTLQIDPRLFFDEIEPVTDPLEPRRVVREHTRSCLADCAPST